MFGEIQLRGAGSAEAWQELCRDIASHVVCSCLRALCDEHPGTSSRVDILKTAVFTPPLQIVTSTSKNVPYGPISMSVSDSVANTTSLDHLVLTVRDLDATIEWYVTVMGMKVETFSSGGVSRTALKFGTSKINLHVSGKEFEPKAQVG